MDVKTNKTYTIVDLAQSLLEELGLPDSHQDAISTGTELHTALGDWLKEHNNQKRDRTKVKILNLLNDGIGRTAAEIAKELYLSKKEINSTLYACSSSFTKSDDKKPLWAV